MTLVGVVLLEVTLVGVLLGVACCRDLCILQLSAKILLFMELLAVVSDLQSD